MIFDKICVAVMCLGAVLAEPPVNNGYLPPKNDGYNYPKPNAPFPPAPSPTYSPPAPRPPTPTYGPPAPRPPAPTYGPPAPRPPAPTYGPPAPRPPSYNPPAPAPRPPAYNPPAPAPRPPAYNPPAPAPRPPAYNPPAPGPTYGPPSPPRPTYGPPNGGNGVLPIPQGPQNSPIPGGNTDHSGADHVHVPGMPFDFNYAVKDDYYGTDYSHNAISDGDVVKGEYKVLLPDGRLQIVTYTADWKNGFNADVKYQGEPTYPAQGGSGSLPGSSPGGSYNSPPATGSGPY